MPNDDEREEAEPGDRVELEFPESWKARPLKLEPASFTTTGLAGPALEALPDVTGTISTGGGEPIEIKIDSVPSKPIYQQMVGRGLRDPIDSAHERLGLANFTQTFPGSGVTKSLIVLLSGHRALAQATALEITELAAAIEGWTAHRNG